MTSKHEWEKIKNNIMGLGDEHSSHKMYYPELQKKLKELNRFKKLMDNIKDIVIQVDIVTETIVYANNSALTLLKYTKANILNTDIRQILRDAIYDDAKRISYNFADENYLRISDLKTSTGEILPVEINLHYQEYDGIPYAVFIARNIQEKVEAETKLIESEASMKRVFDNIYDIVIIHDNEGRILEANEQSLELFELSADEIKTMNVYDVSAKTDQVLRLNSIYSQAMSGDYMVFEWKGFKRLSNKTFDLEVALRKIEWFGQDAILSVMRDITERKNLEENLRSYNNELELRVKERTKELESALLSLTKEIQVRKVFEENLVVAKEELIKSLEKEKELNTLKSRFISMVSHEYRTPLTIIMSSTYLLDAYYKKQKDSEFNKQVEQIQKAVQEMTKMLNDVLSIGKITSGKYQLDVAKFNLIDSINESVEIISDYTNHARNFKVELPTHLCLIETDNKSILIVLNNIIGNAAKYSNENGKIEIKVDDLNKNYKITVKDYGIGIPNTETDNIFEPFFRAKNIGNVAGTGLGLSIVKSMLELLNGNIEISSQENEGTEVVILLPKSIQPTS